MATIEFSQFSIMKHIRRMALILIIQNKFNRGKMTSNYIELENIGLLKLICLLFVLSIGKSWPHSVSPCHSWLLSPCLRPPTKKIEIVGPNSRNFYGKPNSRIQKIICCVTLLLRDPTSNFCLTQDLTVLHVENMHTMQPLNEIWTSCVEGNGS